MIEKLFKGSVRNIEPYVPGKRVEDVARAYGIAPGKVIKLASNENPFGPSEKAVSQILEFSKKISAYPDAEAGELREAIAKYVGLKKENVIAGNGSDEILDIAAKIFMEKGDEAVIPVPTFSLYENMAKLYSGRAVYVPLLRQQEHWSRTQASLEENFEFDHEKISRSISPRTKMIFICSPNNPTGSVIKREDLEDLLENELVVILDEAYVEFAKESLTRRVKKYENLIVLRTFSKAFGLAGLRVGYGVADEKVIEHMLRVKLPFNVGVLAQKAALGALKDERYLKKSVAAVKEGRAFLLNELSEVGGLKVYQSSANFVLLNTEGTGKKVSEISAQLLKRGIIIRDCRTFRGLDEYYARISVGTKQQNQRLVDELKKIFSIQSQ